MNVKGFFPSWISLLSSWLTNSAVPMLADSINGYSLLLIVVSLYFYLEDDAFWRNCRVLVWSFLVAAILVTSWQVFFFSLSWICSVSLGSSDSLLLFQIEVYRWYETAKGVHCNYRLIMLSFHQIVLSLIVGILLILHIKLQTVCTLCNISM